MIRTRVGYTGGTKPHPTYHSLADHSESIEVDYDPQRLTFAELLDVFWRGHRPTRPAWSRQYMSAIFAHGEAQQAAAWESLARQEKAQGTRLYTEILPAETFTLAEDYHQKYALRHMRGVLQEFQAIYPSLEHFIASTAVARANGFASGYGSPALLQAEIDRYGLSQEGQRVLREIVARHNREP